jgi:peptide/nickel transport system substrate-binding protein
MRSYEWGTFFSDIRKGNFQIYTLTWVGIADPDIYYYLFHSQSIPPNGANRGAYRSPEVDRLLEVGRVLQDREEGRRVYRRVQKILARDLPYVSLWHDVNVVVADRRIRGFVLYPDGHFLSLKDVWIE